MASGDETKSRLRGRLDWMALAGVAIAGWLVILVVNKWHIGAPVVFLCLGWVAVLLCGLTLWGSAQAAAGEGTGSDEAGFDLSAGSVAELEKEKRALLKAIKEVEFDREMGKMSDQDAAEISRVYRARAIDILKELEGEDGATAARNVPMSRVIESEVRARLALAGVASRAKAKAQVRAAAKPAGTAAAAGEPAAPSEAGASSEASASSEAGASSSEAVEAGGSPSSEAVEAGGSSSEAVEAGGSSSEAVEAGESPSSEAGASPDPGASAAEAGESSTDAREDRPSGALTAEASAAAAEAAGPDAGQVGAAPSASASTSAPSPKKKKSKAKAKSPRASDGSGGVAGSGSGGAGGAVMQKREDA